jgi:hypothetical protein
LEAGRGFEVRALLAAVQRRITFRTGFREIRSRRQCSGATEAPGCSHTLEQPGEPWSGRVDRRAGSVRACPVAVGASAVRCPSYVHITVLAVLTIFIHALVWLRVFAGGL